MNVVGFLVTAACARAAGAVILSAHYIIISVAANKIGGVNIGGGTCNAAGNPVARRRHKIGHRSAINVVSHLSEGATRTAWRPAQRYTAVGAVEAGGAGQTGEDRFQVTSPGGSGANAAAPNERLALAGRIGGRDHTIRVGHAALDRRISETSGRAGDEGEWLIKTFAADGADRAFDRVAAGRWCNTGPGHLNLVRPGN